MLRIWLPFNKKLNSQALTNKHSVITVSNLSSTYGDGKVCPYALDVSYTWLKLSYEYANTNQISIAFWVKPKTPNAWSDIISLGAGANRIEKSSTDAYIWYNDGNALVSSGTTMFNMSNNTWYHVAVVADGSQVRFYLNGTLSKTVSQSNALSSVFSDGNYILISARTTDGGNRYYGYLNDFRVYDNALSAKEIKLLSQGLVAHYKLKGMGRTNFLKGAGLYTKKNPLVRNASDVSHMNDSYVYHNSVFSVTVPTDGIYSFVLNCDGVPSGHNTSGTVAASRYFSMWLQNTSTGSHYCWTGYGTAANGEKYGHFNIPAGTYSVRTNLYAADSVNYTLHMWNIKVVQGTYDPNDIWCPNSADALYATLGLNKESDCSGYGNHATKANIYTTVNNSPRYETCYQFSGSQYLACGRGAMVTDELTISLWACADDWSTFNGCFISCTDAGGWGLGHQANTVGHGFEIYADSAYYGIDLQYNNLSSGWHHIVATYDKNTIVGYIDGVEKARKTGVPSGIKYNANNGIFIGQEAAGNATTPSGNPYYGKMSDVRIYGTALSANDIADMYKNSAFTTKDGKLLAYDFSENANNNIGKSGVVSSNGFNTMTIPTYDMKLKALDDGTTWARINWLDVTREKAWFTSSEVTKCINKNNRYSRMGIVDKYKYNGEYEFMLTYPSMNKSLPSGYTRLNYIEATGTQWINTNVTGAARWEFDIEFTDITTRQLMGYGPNQDEYWGVQTDSKYGLFAGSTRGNAGNRDIIVHDYNEKTLWVENEILGGICQYDVSDKQYVIFALPPNSQFNCHAKLYRCKCVQSGSLIRDFIPAKRNSDGYVGLFDIVNNVFYGNSGSGTFVSGGIALSQTIDLYNRWIQTSSPNASSVTGYKAINTAWTAHNAGIRKNGSSCVYNCDSGGTWYAPIGQLSTWTDTQYIPAADGSSQTETELWVRTDRFADENKLNIYNSFMTAKDFFEI